MRELQKIAIVEIEPDKHQPRKHFGDAETQSLGQNMLTIGQILPLILYASDGKYVIADGERRWRAAAAVGIAELVAMVLPKQPTEAELRQLQASIDVHRISHSPWERSCHLRIMKERDGLSVAELAASVHMKQAIVSKLLACQRLHAAIQQLVHSGSLGLEKAYIVSQEPSLERQREMVKLYAQLPREQFRQKAKPSAAEASVSVKRARFYLPGGASVLVHGPALTLSEAIALLLETVRQLKRGQAQSKDIVATQKDMRNKARASNVAVE